MRCFGLANEHQVQRTFVTCLLAANRCMERHLLCLRSVQIEHTLHPSVAEDRPAWWETVLTSGFCHAGGDAARCRTDTEHHEPAIPHEMRNEMTPTHIPHGRLVHFLDLSGNPGNKAACTDERHPRRWEPAMPNRIQRRKADTTKLVYLRHRQLVCECMVSGFAPRSGMKTARMANATNPKSAIGLAECVLQCPERGPPLSGGGALDQSRPADLQGGPGGSSGQRRGVAARRGFALAKNSTNLPSEP